MSEEQKWELIQGIGGKFMRKVAAEREARLSGEIVAADFYLRQITFLEVMFDLTASRLGWSPNDALAELRRGEHGLVDIATTPFAEWLDASRRVWWADEGEPERPPHPDTRFLQTAPAGGRRVQHLHRPGRLRSADPARAGVHGRAMVGDGVRGAAPRPSTPVR